MAEEVGSQYLIQVAVAAEGVGPALQEVQSQAESVFADLNATLAGLGKQQPFEKLVAQAAEGKVGIAELTAGIEAARAAMSALAEAQGRIGYQTPLVAGGMTMEQLSVYKAEMRQVLDLQGEMLAVQHRGATSFTPLAQPPLSATVEQMQRNLQRDVEANQLKQQSREALVTGPLGPFQEEGVTNQAALRNEQARLQALSAQLRQIELEAKSNVAPSTLVGAQAGVLGTAGKAEATAAALERQGQIQAEINALIANEAGLSDKVLQARLRILVADERIAAAEATGTGRTASLALQQESARQNYERTIAKEQAALAAQEQAAAGAGGGGGGGFFGGFGKGISGGKGGEGADFSPYNIGAQIGQVAKYIYLYEAFIKVDEAIREGIKLTKEYQDGLVHLDIALQSIRDTSGKIELSQGLLNDLIGIGAKAGVAAGESMEIAARGVQAYHSEIKNTGDLQRVTTQTVQAITEGSVIAADKYTDVQTRLIAVTKEFGLGAEGQMRVLDAATNAHRRFGASIKETLDGLSQVAGLAVQSGFSVEQLTNVIGIIVANTGLSGQAAAGDLKRVIAGQGAPAFANALAEVGVSTTEPFAKQLEDLGGKFQSLSQAQQQQIITTLGGRRAAEALIPLLQQMGDYQAANAYALANTGAAQQEFNRRQETLGGLLRQISGAAKQLIIDIGHSGVGAAFGFALEAALPLIQLLDQALQLFNDLPGPIRTMTFALLELGLAARLLKDINFAALGSWVSGAALGPARRAGVIPAGAGAAAGATAVEAEAGAGAALATQQAQLAAQVEAGLITEAEAAQVGIRALALVGRQVAAEIEASGAAIAEAEAVAARRIYGGSLLAGGAGAVEGAAARGLGTAETAVAGGLAARLGGLGVGMLGLARAALPLGAVIGGIVLAGHVVKLAAELSDFGDKMREIAGEGGGSVDDLRNQLSQYSSLEQDLRHSRSGLFGSIANVVTGGQAGRDIDQIEEQKRALLDEINAIDEAAKALGANYDAFSPQSVDSVQALDEKVKQLAASGYSAAEIVGMLVKGLNDLSGSTAAQNLLNAPKGSVPIVGTTPEFVSGLVGDVIPKTATDITAAQEAVNRINAGITAGGARPQVSLADALNNPDFIKKFQIDLTGDEKDKIIKSVTRDVAGKKFLTPEDLVKIADHVVEGWGIKDPKVAANLREQVLTALRGKGVTGEVPAVDLAKVNPELLTDFTSTTVAQLGTAVSDIQARQGGSQEQQTIRQSALTALLRAYSTALAAGLPSGQELQAVSAVSAQIREEFDRRVDVLAAKEKAAHPEQAQAIDKLAKKIKAQAGQVGANQIPVSIASLGEAENLLVDALAHGGQAIVTIAQLVTLQNEQNLVKQLRAVYNRLNAEAVVAGERADQLDTVATDMQAMRTAVAAGKAKAVLDAAQAKLDKDTAALEGSLTQSPGGQSDAADVAAGSAATAATDTAAQIAAARRLAGIYPGAPVETAAAEVQRAAADLAAAKPGVAFYNALANLHKAQQDYRNALLAAAHIARQLGYDTTNPVLNAAEDLRVAKAKLDSDRRNHGDQATLNQDRLAVREAQDKLEQARFQQHLDAARTNYDLGRITRAQYLAFLDRQRDNLLAIAHRTFQQNQELNQIDQLLKETSKAMQGQFNLGDIRLPTPYEVRRQLAGGGGLGAQATSNVTIYISGADTAKVQGILATYVGPAVLGSATVTSSPKV